MSRVIVLTGFTPGLIYHRLPLIRAMVQRGHDVLAAGPPGDDWVEAPLKAAGARFTEFAVDRNHVRMCDDLRYVSRIRRLLRAESPDLLLCSTVKPNIYGGWAARAEGVRSAAMVTGLGAVFMRPGVRRAIAIRMLRRACRHHDVVFVQNEPDRDDLLRWGVVKDASKVAMTAGSGIDLAAFPELPLPDAPVFLMLSRLLAAKGVREYIAAGAIVRAACPQARVLLAGAADGGPGSVPLTEVQAAHDRGSITYLGHVEDVRELLGEASVCVLPSYHEGTPHSLLEGMASGRATITTDVRGCREVAIPGDTGLIVPVKDAATLANAMLTLAEDGPRRAAMGRAGRALAESRFDAEAVARDMIDTLFGAIG